MRHKSICPSFINNMQSIVICFCLEFVVQPPSPPPDPFAPPSDPCLPLPLNPKGCVEFTGAAFEWCSRPAYLAGLLATGAEGKGSGGSTWAELGGRGGGGAGDAVAGRPSGPCPLRQLSGPTPRTPTFLHLPLPRHAPALAGRRRLCHARPV